MEVSIVVPVHNALPSVDTLLTTLDTLSPRSNIVLVDDASEPETAARLLDFVTYRPSIAKTIYRRNERQQLFTRTVNRGIRAAVHTWNADAVIVLNTDCVLKPGWFYPLRDALNDPQVGMTGYWDNNFPAVDLKKKPYTEVRLPDYVTGHCFVLRVEMLREIGVLCESDTTGSQDPTLGPYKGQAHIGSERILCNKANLHGWKTLYCNAPLVEHGDGKSWGRNLGWLNQFDLRPLWVPNDTLEPEVFYG